MSFQTARATARQEGLSYFASQAVTRAAAAATSARRLANSIAFYVVATELDISPRRLARAIGRERRNMQRAVAWIEDRRDEPVFDRLVSTIAEGAFA